jgi:hypothetical protein
VRLFVNYCVVGLLTIYFRYPEYKSSYTIIIDILIDKIERVNMKTAIAEIKSEQNEAIPRNIRGKQEILFSH